MNLSGLSLLLNIHLHLPFRDNGDGSFCPNLFLFCNISRQKEPSLVSSLAKVAAFLSWVIAFDRNLDRNCAGDPHGLHSWGNLYSRLYGHARNQDLALLLLCHRLCGACLPAPCPACRPGCSRTLSQCTSNPT